MSAVEPSLYGRLIAGATVEQSVHDTLRYWFADYLREVERQNGIPVDSLPQPRSWVISSEIERMPEDQLPAVIIASPGLTEIPDHDGEGRYTASWRVTGAVEHATIGDRYRALYLTRLYALAIRGILVQQPDPTGLIMRRHWTGERYNILDSDADRTVCVGAVDFRVLVPDVVNMHAGPVEPGWPPDFATDQPYPQWPTATDADVSIVKDPLS